MIFFKREGTKLRPMKKEIGKKLIIWIEITANNKTIIDENLFRETMIKCRDSGVTGIIMSVKDTTGFVLYSSELAYHYSLYDGDFKAVDYVKNAISTIHELGMEFYAAFDVFAEGNKHNPSELMKGISEPGFECTVYGIDDDGNAQITKSTKADHLHTVGTIDDFGEIFVNPVNMSVQNYELSLIGEFCDLYHPDAVVLDRVRNIGLSTDFSALSRKCFEDYYGEKVNNWPEDIYTIVQTDEGIKEEPGVLFGRFCEYRALVIRNFVKRAFDLAHDKNTKLMNYVGSWYPLYYQVGANWANYHYVPEEFPWIQNKAKFAQTGYSTDTDVILSGCYYEDISKLDCEKSSKPADWYSVEGAAELTAKVTCNKKHIVDSIFLDQYKECPAKISQAINVCNEHSLGCMIFDLSYIVDRNYWRYMEKVHITSFSKAACQNNEISAQIEKLLCNSFEENFRITKERIKENLFEMNQFDPESSSVLISEKDNELLGFIGVKKSDEREIYPDTAWISIFAVAKGKRGMGYGRMLLEKVLSTLKASGIKKIYIGQDYDNFFSGIPDPDLNKETFFKAAGFTLNADKHYDLEGNTIGNKLIDSFDKKEFEKKYYCETYSGNKDELLAFLSKEFPGRWEFEAEQKISCGNENEEIVLLRSISENELVGYCILSSEKNKAGDKTGFGGLGPIGIAKKIRGNQVGNYILCQSLVKAGDVGVTRVNIDWTILKDFYGQFGFTAQRIYRAGYIEL